MVHRIALILGVSPATAQCILERCNGRIENARNLGPVSFTDVDGVGPKMAERIVALGQFGRIASVASDVSSPIRQASIAARELLDLIGDQEDEHFAVLFLDAQSKVIGRKILTVGSQSFTIVDPRQVFREAVRAGARSIIVGHNHPSGNPEPSRQDKDVTDQLSRAGRLLGLPLLDHIVVTASPTEWTSMAEMGLLPRTSQPQAWVD